jgi:S1-C subfamily serine protease
VGLVAPDGAAAEMGLKSGDVVTKINDVAVSSWSELQGTVASYNTGDKIKITYKRNGREQTGTAVLKNKVGNYEEVAKSAIADKLGAKLETISQDIAKDMELRGGVLVKSILSKDSPIGRTRIQEGFIITSVNGTEITTIEQLSRIISRTEGSIRLEGVYPGYEGTYTYPLNMGE